MVDVWLSPQCWTGFLVAKDPERLSDLVQSKFDLI